MKTLGVIVGCILALTGLGYVIQYAAPIMEKRQQEQELAAIKQRQAQAEVKKQERVKTLREKKPETLDVIKSSLAAGKVQLAVAFLRTLDEIKDDSEVRAAAETVAAAQRKSDIADARQYLKNGGLGQAKDALVPWVKVNDAEAVALNRQVVVAQEKEAAEAARIEKAVRKKQGVRIGMTQRQVLESSWGRPEHVNRTTTGRGTREQWVYGSGQYLYFEDGILTTIQN